MFLILVPSVFTSFPVFGFSSLGLDGSSSDFPELMETESSYFDALVEAKLFTSSISSLNACGWMKEL
ncbi:hypothetical protein CARUB_v10011426mg [Capsella rubella]|uniref:Secreted protein n=1 Tax=Capsella rubella TaxID=81985 RepID=R0ILC9_9BRAS|nr:hypothetical protein CARUB_v10011426mg [Capsella rubella]